MVRLSYRRWIFFSFPLQSNIDFDFNFSEWTSLQHKIKILEIAALGLGVFGFGVFFNFLCLQPWIFKAVHKGKDLQLNPTEFILGSIWNAGEITSMCLADTFCVWG